MKGRNLDHIRRHFKERDPLLFAVLADMSLQPLRKEKDSDAYFGRLCREIISQQLGSGAAAAILKRFTALFPDERATPARVLKYSEQTLRNVGMSWAKARYVRDVADKTLSGAVHFPGIPAMDDEGVIAELTKIKGIGRWTAEMFLMFTLGREDVFSFGDLGLRKGMAMIYGTKKTATPRHMERITAVWVPYRSYGSLAVWHVADSGGSVAEIVRC